MSQFIRLPDLPLPADVQALLRELEFTPYDKYPYHYRSPRIQGTVRMQLCSLNSEKYPIPFVEMQLGSLLDTERFELGEAVEKIKQYFRDCGNDVDTVLRQRRLNALLED